MRQAFFRFYSACCFDRFA